MGNFNRGGKRSKDGFNHGFSNDRPFGGGRKNFGGGRNGGRDGGRPSMHQATCAGCGDDCEVPFRPTGDRPVYCNNCFKKQGGGNNRPNKFGGDRRERPNFGNNDSSKVLEQITLLNAKMDKLMNMLAPKVLAEKNKEPEVKKAVGEKGVKIKAKIVKKKVSAKKKK